MNNTTNLQEHQNKIIDLLKEAKQINDRLSDEDSLLSIKINFNDICSLLQKQKIEEQRRIDMFEAEKELVSAIQLISTTIHETSQ